MVKDIEFYAYQYYNELTYGEKQLLTRTRKLWREARDEVTKSTTFFEAEESSPTAFTKVFLFAVDIPPHSIVQQRAFELLQGDELECYMSNFLNKWSEGRLKASQKYGGVRTNGGKYGGIETRSDWSRGWNIPSSISKLIINKDFKSEYIKPFLVHPEVDPGEKNILIEDWVYAVSGNSEVSPTAPHSEENSELFLSEEDVNFILSIKKEEELSITPIISSIRHRFNLGDIPDSWIEEAYSSRKQLWGG